MFLDDWTPDPIGRWSRGEFRPARIVTYHSNDVNIEVEGTAPGYLVLTAPWYPGWTATLDGRPAPIDRADDLFRAVAVPAGQHRVHLRFEPASLRRGKAIIAVVLAAGLGLGLMSLVRRGLGQDPESVPGATPRTDQASDEVGG